MHDADGLDVEALIAIKEQGGHVSDLEGGDKMVSRISSVDCDIWIPAARPDVIDNGQRGQGESETDRPGRQYRCHGGGRGDAGTRGVLCIPDFISNAGGVICASVEYHGGTEGQAFQAIDEKIRANTAEVLDRARRAAILPRAAAVAMAAERVEKAMSLRRWG